VSVKARASRTAAVRLIAGAVIAAAASITVAAAADSTTARPVANGSLAKARPRLPDGCGDTPTTNGVNQRPETLCGTPGADKIYPGIGDTVRGLGGDDTIYAKNGAPNYIDGGLGSDTAYLDPPRIDRDKGIQRRITSSARPRRAAVHQAVTPDGFPYELPTVECDDDESGSGRHILLLDPPGQKPQMAAASPNAGVVDWQYVAWSTKIYKVNTATRKYELIFQTDWLWDRTYDLVDFTERRHPANVWHSFVEGADDDQAEQEPFAVTESGTYTVRFDYDWLSESVPDLPDRNLADMPRKHLFTDARKFLGQYAAGGTPSRHTYCKFP